MSIAIQSTDSLFRKYYYTFIFFNLIDIKNNFRLYYVMHLAILKNEIEKGCNNMWKRRHFFNYKLNAICFFLLKFIEEIEQLL